MTIFNIDIDIMTVNNSMAACSPSVKDTAKIQSVVIPPQGSLIDLYSGPDKVSTLRVNEIIFTARGHSIGHDNIKLVTIDIADVRIRR